MDIREQIKEVLCDMDTNDLIFDVYNDYLEKHRYDDEKIYNMCDIDEFLGDLSFREALGQIDTDCFDLSADYIMDSMYGYKSLDEDEAYEEVENYMDDIIDYIIDNDEDFGNMDIRDILDEENENDED